MTGVQTCALPISCPGHLRDKALAVDWVGFPPARREADRHLYLGVLGEIESIFDINTQIPNRALDLRVAEQDLHGA